MSTQPRRTSLELSPGSSLPCRIGDALLARGEEEDKPMRREARMMLFALATTTAAALAGTSTTAPAQPPPPAVHYENLTGTVVAIDLRARRLDLLTGVGHALRLRRI